MATWVHLATAPDQMVAEVWVNMLREAGLRAMIRPSDAVSFLGVSPYSCRVQVMDEDLEEARNLLGDEAEEPDER